MIKLPVSLTQVHRLPQKKDTKQMNKQTKILFRDSTSQLARKKCQSNSVLVPSGYISSFQWLPAMFLTRILEEPDTSHIQKKSSQVLYWTQWMLKHVSGSQCYINIMQYEHA